MPRKIHKLLENNEIDFFLIGMASSENDYRLSWALNHAFGLKLVKMNNMEVFQPRLDDPQSFAQFQYFDENSLILYRLIANRSENGYLLEELHNLDYLLQISGEVNLEITDQLLDRINRLKGITKAFKIDPASLKSVHKLRL